MLVVGSPGEGLGPNEFKSQMALWAMFAAPLYMSHDLRNTSDDARAILMNKDIIEIDQDPLGVAARMYFRNDEEEVWARPLFNGDWAVALFNKSGKKMNIAFDPHDCGINVKTSITLKDLEKHEVVGELKPKQIWNVDVESHETKIYRISFN